jgi:hypothetical protein
MVYDGKTSRETSADHDTLTYVPSRSSALKRKLREWMTVARDRSAWGRKVEYKLELPPLIHESPQTLNETRTTY